MKTNLPTFFRSPDFVRRVLLFVLGWLSLSTPNGFAQPTVIPPANQAVCAGAATLPAKFTGTGRVYTWTNSNPSIGLAASGVGDIPSFTAINTTNSSQIVVITVTPSQPACAYIANSGSNTVSVINTTTNQVAATIPVGNSPTGVCVNADGNRVYVTNNGSGTVSVISTGSNQVIATIPVGANPIGIVISPDGNRIYVANNGSGTVSIISTATNTVTGTINVSSFPQGVAVSPDGNRLYVSCRGPAYGTATVNSEINAINTANNQILFSYSTGYSPYGVSVSANGSRIYTANNGNVRYCEFSGVCEQLGPRSVSIFNSNTNASSVNIDVGLGPFGTCLSPDGSRLYVSVETENSIKVINTATNTVSATISVGNLPTQSDKGEDPRGISLNADGSRLYVANYNKGTVKVINTATNTVIATIPVGSNPISLGNFVSTPKTPEGGTAHNFIITVNPAPPTVDKPEDQVVCANAASLPVTFSGTATGYTWTNNNPAIGLPASGNGTIPSFTSPSTPQSATLTVTPRRASYAYIPTNSVSGSVKVINTTTKALVTSIPVGQLPTGVSVSLDGTRIYVVNTGSGTVSAIIAATNTVLSIISVGASPSGAAVSPDGHFVYVTNTNAGTVSVISTETNTVIATISVGDRPRGVVVTPDGSRVYVANYGSNTVSVIDASTQTVIKTIPVGTGPVGLAIGISQLMMVANSGSNNAYVVDVAPASTAYNTVVLPINTGQNPQGVSVSPDGKRFYIANTSSNSVTLFDLSNFSLTTVPVGNQPVGVSVSDDGSQVYITNNGSNNVNVLDATTNQVISTIDVGTRSVGLGNFVGLAGCSGTPQTFVIAVKNALTPSINGKLLICTGSPNSLTATGGGTYVWNTGAMSSTISAATSGIYSVTVSSGQCTATATASVTATSSRVTITSPPPASVDVVFNTNASIPVGVSGDYAQYQWYKDGGSLGASQQSPTLSLSAVQLNQTGSYSLVVTNVCNSVAATTMLYVVQAIRYVKMQASGRGDGTSWGNASSSIQAMIDGYKVSQVWVATGLYKPTGNYDRTISFHMKSGVAILGGFPASGSPVLTDRNPSSLTTTLSGDLYGAGTAGTSGTIQVIHNEGVDNTAVLDGFIIRDGFHNIPDLQQTPGGGGMYNANSSPRVVNCMFLDNFAVVGGAMYNLNSSPTLINCVLSGNYVYDFGPGAGINNNNSTLTLINCSLANNPSFEGPQTVRNENNSSTSLTNCIIWNGTGQGSDLEGSTQSFTANNCIFDPATTNYIGANNLTTDPKFVDPGSVNLRLQAGSPAINSGSNVAYTTANGPAIDLGGTPRIQGGTIDRGAYELAPNLTPLLYARPAIAYGTTPITVVIDITELNSVTTSGLTTVRINKDALVNLSLDPTITMVGGRPVQNRQWSLTSGDPNYYILSTSQPIVGGDRLSVGMSGELRPGSTSGVLTLSGSVVNSVGESSLNNNVDADKIDYFQQ